MPKRDKRRTPRPFTTEPERICELTTERDRLKAINAELLEALEAIVNRMDKGFVPSRILLFRARAALAKARE